VIEEADLEGLEECPFCDYKCVKTQEKLFRCGNVDGGCGAVSWAGKMTPAVSSASGTNSSWNLWFVAQRGDAQKALASTARRHLAHRPSYRAYSSCIAVKTWRHPEEGYSTVCPNPEHAAVHRLDCGGQ
jgi:hypothetical protein